MMGAHGGLGRGLDALIPSQPETAAPSAVSVEERSASLVERSGAGAATDTGDASEGHPVVDVPLDQIQPNPRQPRTEFDEAEIASLSDSIAQVGVLQPIVVRPVDQGGYEIVMGERRFRASKLAGLDSVPAIVRDTGDEVLLRDALLENIHRSDLNPLEEAAAYQALLSDLGSTQAEVARLLGVSRAHITNQIRLLGLPPAVQRRVAAGVLSAGHARALLGLPDDVQREQLATRIVAEGLSVRATEEAVALILAEPGGPTRKRRQTKESGGPALDAVAEGLSDRLETRVSVMMGRRKGKIVVEFASLEDLDRIVGTMNSPGPTDPATQV